MNIATRTLLRWLAGAAAVLAATPVGAQTITAARIPGGGPIMEPQAAFWAAAAEAKVPLLPQTMTTPTNPQPAVSELSVRAVHNGQWLALRIEWKDPTRSDRLVTDEFGDQMAVEFPIDLRPDALPSPMMGHVGGRVNILQWRAPFQRDIEHGEPTVATLYPNALIDVYPDQVLRATDARPYMGALGLDNPVSRPHLSPVLDQMAEGWGSMTVKPDQHADGRGVWENGTWKVVITTPMATESANSPRFAPGAKTMAAFAVWEGSHREVGARKAWSSWTALELAE